MTSMRFNPHEALVCAMVLMAASDGNMTDAELNMMQRLVTELPVFSDFSAGRISSVTEACMGLLDQEDGIDLACDLVREALPSRLRETAYLLACEVAAADGMASQAELRLLQELAATLDLDPLVIAAIERAAKARYQVI